MLRGCACNPEKCYWLLVRRVEDPLLLPTKYIRHEKWLPVYIRHEKTRDIHVWFQL
jgi:hypothetical protein